MTHLVITDDQTEAILSGERDGSSLVRNKHVDILCLFQIFDS